METILLYALGTLLTGGALWASIWLLDRYNSTNKLPTAFLIGGVLTVFGGMTGGFLMFLPLLALMYLLTQFYDLGIIKSFGVVILMGLMLHFAMPVVAEILNRFAGTAVL